MNKKILLSLIGPILILILRPLELNLNQSIILSSLLLTITWWVTGIIPKTKASIFLILAFCFFSRIPIKEIINFPLSNNFITIVFSFLFSQGIANSGLTDKILLPILFKFTDNVLKLLLSIIISTIILIFVIPQPFSRVIILSLVFYRYFERINLSDKLKEILMFSVFAFSVFINMSLKNGDIILNNAILSMGNLNMTDAQWMRYMTIPTVILCALAVLLFLITFKKDLKEYKVKVKQIDSNVISERLTVTEKKYLLIIGIIVLLWATESQHNIKGSYIVVIGTLIMFILKLINKKDLKSINIGILVFLTAVFSIGKVMTLSGTGSIIFSQFKGVFPKEFSIVFILIVVAVSIILHTILGSNLTTMSLIVPGLLTISKGIVEPVILVFILYISVSAHYLLPFHNVIILLGEGNNYYSSKTVTKYGLGLTFVIIFSIVGVYMTWWDFINIF